MPELSMAELIRLAGKPAADRGGPATPAPRRQGTAAAWSCTTIPARWSDCRSMPRWPAASTCCCREHPGYGQSERPAWMRTVRDLAAVYRGLLAELGRRARRCSASASAAGSPPRWRAWRRTIRRSWCWSAPMGIKPPRGRDPRPGAGQLHRLCPGRLPRPGRLRRGLRRRAEHRPAGEMGHLPRDELPHRLEALHVQPDPAAPAGRRARARAGGLGRRGPRRAAERRRALRGRRCRNARLEIVAGCGHCVEMEQPAELARLVTDFVACNADWSGSDRHAPDVLHRAADVGLPGGEGAWSSAPRR